MNIQKDFNKLLKFKSIDDRLHFQIEMLQLSIISQIIIYMDKNNITKKELAYNLNMTENTLTKIFTADKIITIKTLTKFLDILNLKIKLIGGSK